MGSMNSLKRTQILSLDNNLQSLMAKNSNKQNKLVVACIHRDNYIWKEHIQ